MSDIDFSKLCMSPDEVDTVIYHGGCADGFTSAFSCYYYNKINNTNKEITYHYADFSKPNPNVKGKNVLICDFSYKYPILCDMIQSANKLVILDHHKTAEADLKAIPDENKVFRMDHSGAYITWKYFNQSDSSVPRLITYVEDNDIWLKKQPNTREFTSYLFSMPMTFDEYEKFLDDNYIDNTVFPIGSGMMKQNESFILQGIRRSTPTFINIDGKFYFNVVLNTSILKSELGNRVLSEYPNCDFSTMYNYDNLTNETWLSLRSDDMKTDVSEIAKKYNGGGHRSASGVSRYGFTANLPCIVLGDINVYKLLDTINHNDNIVSLNTNYLKKELALYLLQLKYIDKFKQEISHACSILRNKNKSEELYNIDISKVWHYDGSLNETFIIIHYKSEEVLEKYLNTINKEIFSEIKKNSDDKLYEYKLKGLNI